MLAQQEVDVDKSPRGQTKHLPIHKYHSQLNSQSSDIYVIIYFDNPYKPQTLSVCVFCLLLQVM